MVLQSWVISDESWLVIYLVSIHHVFDHLNQLLLISLGLPKRNFQPFNSLLQCLILSISGLLYEGVNILARYGRTTFLIELGVDENPQVLELHINI